MIEPEASNTTRNNNRSKKPPQPTSPKPNKFPTNNRKTEEIDEPAPPETPTNQLKEILRRHPSPIAHPQQHVVLTCYIPPSKVGAVIGRQGKTILGVQRDASVRMSVGTAVPSTYSKDNDDTQEDGKEDDPWTPVKISGDVIGCIHAARLLNPLVETEMDDLVLDIPIQ